MFKSHLKITASATNIEQLKNALLVIVKKLDNEDFSSVVHDDYNFSFEMFDNDTLKMFDIEPNEFLILDLPSNL